MDDKHLLSNKVCTGLTNNTYRVTTSILVVLAALISFVKTPYALTYTVTGTGDTGAPGDLRWCINQAEINIGVPDTIVFQIPGAGPHTIFITSQLPLITDQAGLVINGLTQAGASPGANPPSTASLLIVLDGSNAGPSHGLWILCSNNEVRGLVIQNFEQDGIRMQATPVGTNGNYIYCNFVGTDVTGTMQQGNGTNQAQLWAGIYVICTPGNPGIASNNMIEGNLVSNNYAENVGIANCPPGTVDFNVVWRNYIGTDITGTQDFGAAHDGVYIGEGATDNSVDQNLISGNDFDGVGIVGYGAAAIFTDRNIVFNNIIGLDINGVPLPNTIDGVAIGTYGTMSYEGYAEDNIVDTNIIAHNGRHGVSVWEYAAPGANADRNLITRNSIYNNTGLGIDLGQNGVTTNDTLDPDMGANDECNFPVIDSARYNPATSMTTIYGSVDVQNPNLANIELFWSGLDPTGYGEGMVYLGNTVPSNTGAWSFIVSGLVQGDTITATTTDEFLNTSEFCLFDTVRVTGIEELDSESKPLAYVLQQNTPNPCDGVTAISYGIPEACYVNLSIFDACGRHVITMVDEHCAASQHTVYWNGNDKNGVTASDGIYFYILQTEEFTAAKKLIRSH